jgi:hypothetical protein
MSDLLEQATRALRETTADPQPRSGLTKARVLDSAEKRYAPKRSGGGVLRWAVALVAALAASTALARVAQYWPEIKRALVPEAAEHSEAAPAKKKAAKKPAQPAAAEQRPVSKPVVVPAEAPVPENAPATQNVQSESGVPGAASEGERSSVVQRAKPAARRAKVTPKPVFGPEPVAEAPVKPAPPVVTLVPAPDAESADLALFRRAQRLHLNRDPRALAAWDDYLRVAGEGPLAPEARYNRALCLVRLGRKAEAKAALAPFADGEYGTYRRTEAKALMEALDASN